MFFGRWSERESKVESKHERREGVTDNPLDGKRGKMYQVNGADVTVWDDGTVTAKRSNYVSDKPDSHFPNMRVEEGVLTFPIEDMVGLILARCTPLELAQGLFSDEDVRDELRMALECQYASFGNYSFEDKDRRKFLHAVKEAVHNTQLGVIQDKLVEIEINKRSQTSYYRWKRAEAGYFRSLWEWVDRLIENRLDANVRTAFEGAFTTPDKLDKHLQDQQDQMQLESVGPQWHEARDYWRRRLEELFPGPAEPMQDDTKHGIL